MGRTVAGELEALLAQTYAYSPVSPELVADLGDRLAEEVDAGLERHGLWDHPHVIRLPKGRLSAVHECGLRAAKSTPTITPEQSLLGNALDVAASLMTVRRTHTGDAWTNATEIWEADRDTDRLDELAALDEVAREELADLVRERCDTLARCMGELSGGWWPRSQDRVSIGCAGGRVVLSGVFDLFLGGGPSERPSVVIEIKAGSRWPGHVEDGRLYALLATLRDGSAPAAVISLSAGDATVIAEPVRASVLETALERLVAGLDIVLEMATGSIPDPKPGSGCRHCSLLADCPAGERHLQALDLEAGERS